MKRLLASIIFLGLFIGSATLQAHPAFNVSRGMEALEVGNLEAAEAELQKARFADPDNPVIHYDLGIVNYRKRNFSAAAGYFAASAERAQNPEARFASLYNLGNSAFRAGDYAAAISAYEGSLEIRTDDKAEYNLKVAKEKLQKQMERQQQNKKDQQGQQQDQQGQQQDQQGQQQDQQGQSQDQQGQQQDQQGQSQDQQGQQQDQQGQQQDQQGQQQDQQGQQQDQQGQQQDQQGQQQDQQGQKSGENQSSESKEQKDNSAEKPSTGESESQKPAGEDSQQQPQNSGMQNASDTSDLASGAQELTADKDNSDDENRPGDVQIDNRQSAGKDEPEASQRARALKNSKVNPYMIEKILKEMEAREREIQLRYRNEQQRSEEMDPFEMDADELRNWFEKRRRPAQKPSADEPDW